MLPSTLTEARRLGVKRYFTGKPCSRGHVAERLSSCGRCVDCHQQQKKIWDATPKGKLLRRKHDRSQAPQRRLRLRKRVIATPKWADNKAISEFYIACPAGLHVDHIIPLNNPDVCGLHVLENLQYLPAELNLKKGNSVETVALEANVCPIRV